MTRINELRKFYLDAKSEGWELLVVGQRFQIIKKNEFEGGKLQYGTEVVSSKDGTIACLLGASPGDSKATHVLLSVLKKAIPEITNSENKKNIKGHGATVEKKFNRRDV